MKNNFIISDEDLEFLVKKLWKTYLDSVSTFNFNKFFKNKPDPIKLTFDKHFFNLSIVDLLRYEIFRQQDKTRNNAIGLFHQNIFKYIKGWKIPKSGFDIVNDEGTCFVELKNKFNTMNSSSQKNIMLKMLNQIAKNNQNQCFLVQIIAKESQNKIWSIFINNKKEKINNPRIRIMSIDHFYKYISKNDETFVLLINKINTIINKIVNEKGIININKNLTEIFKDKPIDLKSFYYQAFKNYLGLPYLRVLD